MKTTLRVISLVLLAGLAACAEELPPITGRVEVENFDSAIVGDEYVLRVRLPPGYDESDSAYPLVVQLDPTFVGLEEFATTAGLASEHGADGSWPEAIVLGVDYPDPFTRVRDYALPDQLDPDFGGDGADLFYAALRDEIVPWAEERYRIDPAQRVLVGHSMGATFAWYTAFRHAPPDPPLFAGVLAIDTGIDEALFTCERWHAERSTALPLSLYSASAAYNGASEKITVDAMAERLAERGYENLALLMETFETDHGGIIQPGFERGLDFILGGAR
jgi:uncharacterized protein